MKQARRDPNDFEAQLTAASSNIRFRDSIKRLGVLLAANKIKPTGL